MPRGEICVGDWERGGGWGPSPPRLAADWPPAGLTAGGRGNGRPCTGRHALFFFFSCPPAAPTCRPAFRALLWMRFLSPRWGVDHGPSPGGPRARLRFLPSLAAWSIGHRGCGLNYIEVSSRQSRPPNGRAIVRRRVCLLVDPPRSVKATRFRAINTKRVSNKTNSKKLIP